MATAPRILYVYPEESSIHDPAALSALTEQDQIVTAHTASAARDRFQTDTIDCVLAAYQLPDSDGLALFESLTAIDSTVPFVLYPQDGSEELASAALSAGVTEYIPQTADSAQVNQQIKQAITSSPTLAVDTLRQLTDVTDDVLWLISADWEDLLFISSDHATLWGQPEATLRADPSNFIDGVHPDDQSRAQQAVDRVQNGESVEIELRVNPTESFQRRVRITAQPIVDQSGTVTKIAGATQEITERHTKARELVKEQQVIDSIFNALPDLLYTYNIDGTLRRWNDQFEAETGYTGDEIDGMHLTEFVPDDEVENITTSFENIVDKRQTVTVESALETKAGERIPFEFTGAPIEAADGSLRGVTGTGRNIAARKERERELQLFKEAVENAGNAIYITNANGIIEYVNPAFEAVSGYSAADAIGRTPNILKSGVHDEEFYQTLWETILAGETWQNELVNQRKSGERYIIEQTISPITDDDGTVNWFVAVNTDITDRKHRKQALQVLNRVLRHNMRNELNVINGRLNYIHTEHLPSLLTAAQTIDTVADTLREYNNASGQTLTSEPADQLVNVTGDLHTISEQITTDLERATAVTEELQTLSEKANKIQDIIETDATTELQAVSTVLQQTAERLQSAYPTADVSVNCPAAASLAVAANLQTAIEQLLENALKHNDSQSPEVVVTIETHQQQVTIKIADNGPGIPDMEQQVLANGEETPLLHGSGIGLWMVYWATTMAGGELSIDDREPKGSVVTLELPAGSDRVQLTAANEQHESAT